MAIGRLGSKALTGELRKLASEAVSITDDGTLVTREQLLAQMIWRQAMGWTEEVRDDEGNLIKKYHPPVAWCQQFLYERIEGKSQVVQPDNETGIKAADKVRELARDRVNAMATAKAGGPPKHTPKKP